MWISAIFCHTPCMKQWKLCGAMGTLTVAKENTHIFLWEYVITSFLTLFPPSSNSWSSNGKKK